METTLFFEDIAHRGSDAEFHDYAREFIDMAEGVAAGLIAMEFNGVGAEVAGKRLANDRVGVGVISA